MSGVMTKVAIYGFVRIVFDLAGAAGLVVVAAVPDAGAVDRRARPALRGVRHDLKRVLAYSTVENIGIIFVGLGLALAFKSTGLAGSAAVAWRPPCCTRSTIRGSSRFSFLARARFCTRPDDETSTGLAD